VPHYLSDVLLLSTQCTMCLDASCVQNGFEKFLFKRQGLQITGAKRDELLPEFLQRQILTFSRAFAGLCIVHRLKYLSLLAPFRGREFTTRRAKDR